MHFIYDFDGTIVNSLPLIIEAYRYALTRQGIDLADEEIISECFNVLDEDVAGKFSIDEKRFIADYRGRSIEVLKQALLFPGIIEVAGKLSPSIGTMQTQDRIDQNIQNLGIRHLFAHVVGLVGDSKANTFRKICELEKINPSEAIVVGDSEYDMKAAKEIGAKAVLFYPEENKRFLPVVPKADFVIKRHEEILEYV